MPRSATAMLLAGLALSGCKGKDDAKPNPRTTSTGDTSTTQTTLPPDPRVTASGPILCETPSARQTQVFNRQVLGDAWEKEAEYRTPAWSLAWGGRGVAVADFTGDGIPDILVPRELFPAEFLVGHPDGSYTGATQTAFGGVELLNHNGASAADIDGDGDMDGMLYGLMGTATLLWNDGSGAFTVETREDWDTGDSGFGCGHSASWADYDRDGDLDLFYGRLGGTSPYDGSVFFCDSRLLDSNGDGTFTDATAKVTSEVQDIRVMASGWFDFDDDGWLDLYAVSDAPPMQNWLMWNQQGNFATSVGTGLEFVVAGMGLAAGDLNSDDVVDVMVTGINELPTLVSFPESGIWIESALAWNLTNQKPLKAEVAWGGEFADLDNDGYLEMIETYGGLFGSSYAHAQPDEIHLNQGDNTFVHVGADWGWDDLDVNRGFVIADLNDDGWLDTVKRELGGVVFVDIANCGEAAWLKIRLRDEGRHNHHAIGARVTIEAAGHRQTRWVTAGSTSYCSADVPEVHFGLGDADIVDKIEVLWPTGELVTYSAHHTRQILEIRPE